jgi:thiamine kinase-like enzyme
MTIDTSNLVQLLLSEGLISQAALISGDVMIGTDLSRHKSYAILLRGGQGLFAKRIRPGQPASAETLLHEARCYQMISTVQSFEPFREIVPKFLAYIPRENLLVMELVDSADNLLTFHRKKQSFSLLVAEKLGKALGLVHKQQHDRPNEPFNNFRPWILSLQESSLYGTPQSGANIELLRLMGGHPFRHKLEELGQNWADTSFVHGDLKWENCILGGGDENGKIYLVDWEIGGFGDPLWDVGSLLSSYVAAWAFSIPIQGGEANPSEAKYPLEAIRPAMRAFWESYAESRGVFGSETSELLKLSISYMAARLIQTVYEYNVGSTVLSPSSIAILQLTSNLFENVEAGFQLLHEQ